jgi:hypothetical protein
VGITATASYLDVGANQSLALPSPSAQRQLEIGIKIWNRHEEWMMYTIGAGIFAGVYIKRCATLVNKSCVTNSNTF